mmetsp:Transcript_19486/g.54306  ORF Transcript_19486/g.54306 Transcript_19486/m.54306 type:complete len:102 (+) Transcript_19486:1094-1399(+)
MPPHREMRSSTVQASQSLRKKTTILTEKNSNTKAAILMKGLLFPALCTAERSSFQVSASAAEYIQQLRRENSQHPRDVFAEKMPRRCHEFRFFGSFEPRKR